MIIRFFYKNKLYTNMIIDYIKFSIDIIILI